MPAPEPTVPGAGALARAGERVLLAGLVLALAGVPLTMDAGGYNLFGPAKGVALGLSAALVALGIALAPGRFIAALKMVRHVKSLWAAGALAALVLASTVMSWQPLTSLAGSYPEYAGVVAIVLWAVVALGAAAVFADPQSDHPVVWRALSIAVIWVALYGISQRMGIDPVHYRAGLDLSRARSTLGNASNLGLYLAVLLPLMVWRTRAYVEPSAGWRAAAYASAGLGLLALLFTESRGAWLGLFAASVLAVAYAWRGLERPVRKRALFALVALGALFLLATAIIGGGTGERAAAAADPTGGTAAWRVAVWGSAARMAADRPLAGYGPNSFRLAYPLYRPEQLAEDAADPQIVANAHNIFANTAAESGPLAALVLLAWVVLLAIETTRALRTASGREAAAATSHSTLLALALGLVAGLVALQFHFLTLDTGPLFFALAALLTLRASEANLQHSQPEPRADASAVTDAGGVARFAIGVPFAAIAIAALAVSVAMMGAVRADRAVRPALIKLANESAEWAEVAEAFDAIASAAPWDPSFRWLKGTAAVQRLATASDPSIYEDGVAALEAAAVWLPHDTALMADRADLDLAWALSSEDTEAARLAVADYEALIDLDPNNGVLWTGLGSAQAATGDWESAVASYERGVELTPESVAGWANLSVAYERIGDGQDAYEARARAAELAR